MKPGPQAAYVIRHPGAFALRVIKGFRANQGLLLAGAVAYYALLSIVPLLILMAIALSHVVDQAALLEALGRYIGWLAPGQSDFIVGELEIFWHTAICWAGCCWPPCCFSARWLLPCWKTRCR